MLSLLKRKSDGAAAPTVPAWHPNFRNYERLPDVKVVRTAFFVNAAAIAVLISLGTYFVIREMQLHVLRTQIAARQSEIDRDKKPSDAQVALFRKFETEQKKVEDVDAFVTSKPVVSEILIRLARTLPENIALKSIDLRDAGLVLRMYVRGSPEDAAGYATAYLDQLRADQTLTAFDHDKFEFTSQARDPGAGGLVVEFLLHAKGAPKK
jgi:hypothetical protein